MQKKKIAITGGIGSGKSTICNLIKELNYPVFSCDEIYHELKKERFYINEIDKNFPNVVENGVINTKKLSNIVFFDSEALEKLNKISHTLVMKELMNQMENANTKLVFAEVPLLFEGKFENLFDNIIVVLREKSVRIKSVEERDGLTKEEILARMNNQYNYPDEYLDKPYYIKDNMIYLRNDKLSELNDSVNSIIKIL